MYKYLTLCYIFFFFLILRRLSFLKTFLVSFGIENTQDVYLTQRKCMCCTFYDMNYNMNTVDTVLVVMTYTACKQV